MQLHDLKSKDEKDKKRIGRGGARGSFSGRGIKGQKKRAGSSGQPLIRRIIKRYPKLRGYNTSDGTENAVVNVWALEAEFEEDEEVTPQALWQKGLIKRRDGKLPPVKILGEGELETALEVKDCKLSESAEEKIINADGTV